MSVTLGTASGRSTSGGVTVTAWTAYTPTILGFGTPSAVYAISRRVGDTLEVIGFFTSGTSTGADASVSLGYNGSNANVTTLTTMTLSHWGVWSRANSGDTSGQKEIQIAPNVQVANFTNPGTGGLTTPLLGNQMAISGEKLYVNFKAPIDGWTVSN